MEMITERLKLKDIFPEKAKEVAEETGKDEDSIEFIRKGLIGEVKEIDKGERTAVEVISTKAVDRDGEVLLPIGANLEYFKKAPQVLWAHDYKGLPIGKALWIKKNKDMVLAKTKYANHQFAEDVWNLKKDRFLKTNSVGFIPYEWVEDKEEIKKLVKKYDIKTEDPESIKRIYTKWELLEYSNVPVPANPEALTLMVKNIQSEELKKTFETMIKGVIPYKRHPLAPEDTKWDASVEVKKADVKDLKEMCTWYDSANPDIKTSYKLPHHKVERYLTVWNGVRAAMGALFGARGGVNIPEKDRKGVYNHLAKHYKEFDKEVPEFKEYTEEELKSMFPEIYEEEKEDKILENKEGIGEILDDYKSGKIEDRDEAIIKLVLLIYKRAKEIAKEEVDRLIQEMEVEKEKEENQNKEAKKGIRIVRLRYTEEKKEGDKGQKQSEKEVKISIDKEDIPKIIDMTKEIIKTEINKILGKID